MKTYRGQWRKSSCHSTRTITQCKNISVVEHLSEIEMIGMQQFSSSTSKMWEYGIMKIPIPSHKSSSVVCCVVSAWHIHPRATWCLAKLAYMLWGLLEGGVSVCAHTYVWILILKYVKSVSLFHSNKKSSSFPVETIHIQHRENPELFLLWLYSKLPSHYLKLHTFISTKCSIVRLLNVCSCNVFFPTFPSFQGM
jgi:hypothetical protein